MLHYNLLHNSLYFALRSLTVYDVLPARLHATSVKEQKPRFLPLCSAIVF
jgi:hypothetical protein